MYLKLCNYWNKIIIVVLLKMSDIPENTINNNEINNSEFEGG